MNHPRTFPFRYAIAIAAVTALFPSVARAHEDHAPLPTKGVTIAGNKILLSDKARLAIGLETAEIDFGDLPQTVEVNARVESPWKRQAMITSLVPGKIERVLVRPGEKVAPGQELARVVSMDLESLQLALLQADSEQTLAKLLVDQFAALDQQGVIAGKSLLEARATLTQRRNQVGFVELKLRALGLDDVALETIRETARNARENPGAIGDSPRPLPHVSITSPIAGVITHADVRVGQDVTPADHLYHVVSLSTVWIVGEVLESDVRHLKKGQAVEAAFASHPGEVLKGRIDHVRLKMDRRTRTQPVVIAVDNRRLDSGEWLLRAGMFGRLTVTVEAKRAVVCPTDALIETRAGSYVLVERAEGKYESMWVKQGLRKGGLVEIFDRRLIGLKVVVVGNYLLASLLGNEHKARTEGVAKEKPVAKASVTVVEATVELPTDRQVFATSPVEGRITRIHVEPSQTVRAGDVLAEVDSLQLRSVQLELLQALSKLRLTNQALVRMEELGKQGITAKKPTWELKSQRDILNYTIDSLRRQLRFFGLSADQIAELQRADLTRVSATAELLRTVPIRAPADGRIVGFGVVPGQVVRPEDRPFEIHDLSKVWVKGYVFQRDVSLVFVGQSARVTFSAFPDLEPVGKVVRIAPAMEANERVLPIWVEVDNPDERLKQGMLARVTVLQGKKPVNE